MDKLSLSCISAVHFLDNQGKDDPVPDTNSEEEFEEHNPDDYKLTVSRTLLACSHPY